MDVATCRAVVVGGASGMARATAERIAKAGGRVAILDRTASAGAEVARSLGGTFHPCDVTDFDGTGAAITAAADALGGLDAGINTAGGGIGARTASAPLRQAAQAPAARGIFEMNIHVRPTEEHR